MNLITILNLLCEKLPHYYYEQALFLGCDKDHIDIVKFALQNGVDPNIGRK